MRHESHDDMRHESHNDDTLKSHHDLKSHDMSALDMPQVCTRLCAVVGRYQHPSIDGATKTE